MNPLCVFFALLSVATATVPTYRAYISPLDGSGVSGIAVVYTQGDTVLGYAGYTEGVAANLGAADCTATNGCGAHIHSGFSCASSSAQGGHYFATDRVSVDPWIDERYTSDANGLGTYANVIDIGTADVKGRAFLIHDSSGARVGCGLLEEVPESELLKGVSNGAISLTSINDSDAHGTVTVYEPDDEYVCYFGRALGLLPDVNSFLLGGSDCTK